MNHRPVSLSEFFREHRVSRKPLALATIAHTIGSTYRKAGAQMLIGADGSAAGLLSGGCLEADLVERARHVIATGEAAIVEYDTRSSDDILWGIGLGCEGAMRILLTRLDSSNDYQPFAFTEECRANDRHGATAFVITTSNATAHFAGALGKRTWLLYLADRPPFHYWAHGGARRCLWYPSVEIVSATHLTDWNLLAGYAAKKLEQEVLQAPADLLGSPPRSA